MTQENGLSSAPTQAGFSFPLVTHLSTLGKAEQTRDNDDTHMSNEHGTKIEVRDLRDGDWIWAHKAVLFSEISDSAYRVYCALGAYAGNRDQQSWPSFTTIAAKIHSSKSTVMRAMRLLEAAELVRVDRRDGTSNLYTLLPVPKLVKVTPPKKSRSPHHRLVAFFEDTAQKTRGVKVVWNPKDFGHLKRVLGYNILTEDQIEQLMLYYLASQQYRKFAPSLSVFFSAGIFTGLMNDLKNSQTFWKELDGYSMQLLEKPAERKAYSMTGMSDLIAKLSVRYNKNNHGETMAQR